MIVGLLVLNPPLCYLPQDEYSAGQFDEEDSVYRGQLVGSLNSYHHQVTTVLRIRTLDPGSGIGFFRILDSKPIFFRA
jgi:hypothetical protein